MKVPFESGQSITFMSMKLTLSRSNWFTNIKQSGPKKQPTCKNTHSTRYQLTKSTTNWKMRKSVGFGFMEQNAQSFHLTIRLNAADVVFVINAATIVSVATRALFSEHLRTYVYK